MKRIFLLFLMLCGLSFQGVMAQDNPPLPPIYFVDGNAILRWDPEESYTLIAGLGTPDFVPSPNVSYTWREVVFSPDGRYAAYTRLSSEWIATLEEYGVREGDDVAISTTVHLVDLSTGETEDLAMQVNEDPYEQINHWSLSWTLDSQQLLWMQESLEGDLILYDLATHEKTLLVENLAPFSNSASVVGENRILIREFTSAPFFHHFSLYDLEGTLVRDIGTLENTGTYPSLYEFTQDNIPYIGTSVERINLETGDISPMPAGNLLRYSTSASGDSLMISPAIAREEGCTVDLILGSDVYLDRLIINSPVYISPDGSAVLYHDAASLDGFVILHYTQDEGLVRINLPDPGLYPSIVYWGQNASQLSPTSDSFMGSFACHTLSSRRE